MSNNTYGITVEDLEKAASVRLFEKAAAAEGINLAGLTETQVNNLYSAYQQSSEENTMNDEIIDLFEKQAAYEGVDLDALSDDELAYVYNNFVSNLEDEEYGEYDDYEEGEEEEAYEKLAEAEILGRHMARAYMDELEKEARAYGAGSTDKKPQLMIGMNNNLSSGEVRAMEAKRKSQTAKAEKLRADLNSGRATRTTGYKGVPMSARESKMQYAKEQGGRYMQKFKNLSPKKKAALVAAGVIPAAGLAYAATREKKASVQINDFAIERANEFIEFGKEAGYDGSLIDDLALEILEDNGYDLSPLY